MFFCFLVELSTRFHFYMKSNLTIFILVKYITPKLAFMKKSHFWRSLVWFSNSHNGGTKLNKANLKFFKLLVFNFLVLSQRATWVDTGCFWHWCIDFGHINLGMHKFSLKVKLKLPLNAIPIFRSDQQRNVNIITRKQKINITYSLFGLLNDNIGASLCSNLVG